MNGEGNVFSHSISKTCKFYVVAPQHIKGSISRPSAAPPKRHRPATPLLGVAGVEVGRQNTTDPHRGYHSTSKLKVRCALAPSGSSPKPNQPETKVTYPAPARQGHPLFVFFDSAQKAASSTSRRHDNRLVLGSHGSTTTKTSP